MNTELQGKAVAATKAYLAKRGYEVLEDVDDADGIFTDIVAIDGAEIVFADVNMSRQLRTCGLPAENAEAARERMELAAGKWFSQHKHDDELVNMRVRFDIISLMVTSDHRALLPVPRRGKAPQELPRERIHRRGRSGPPGRNQIESLPAKPGRLSIAIIPRTPRESP